EMHSILRQGGFEDSSDVLTSGSALAGLMERVEGAVPGTAGQDFDQDRMLGILQEVESQVGVLMQATDSKIIGLEEKLASIKSTEKDATPADSEETMRVLAEITQELCQPLSVVNCSIDMVKDQRLGSLEQSQADMLDLASTSGQRLLTLINKLGEITGMPSTLNPQEDILSEIYK
ncbi:MAG: signal transduction histidine kinase, partial [Candidatus Promineifilaceae bacterium]